MASNVPVTRQIAWVSLIPQLFAMGLIIFIFYMLKFEDPLLFGTWSYLIMFLILRKLVAKDHRQGMKLVKQEKFIEAIPLFEKSIAYFTKNSWVDKYRYLTILSACKMTYKEMGLCNIAFCYSQTNNGQKAKEYYELTLTEFPKNGLAKAGLNMINSIGQTRQTET